MKVNGWLMLVRDDLGDPVMEKILSKTMTISEDTVTIPVPAHERWIVDSAYLKNGTLSSGDLAAYVAVLDSGDNIIAYLSYGSAVGSGQTIQYPSTDDLSRCLSGKFIVYGEQKIKSTWDRDWETALP